MKPFENALSGFNHNIKHKGQLYHIQTEDSGKHNPTVTTLLFLGGNILASLKASYAEHLHSEELPKRVRELMELQHKQMLRNLLAGQYDKKEALSKHWKVGQLEESLDETNEWLTSEIENFPAPPPSGRPSRPLPVVTQEPVFLGAEQAEWAPAEGSTSPLPGGRGRPSRPLPPLTQERPAFEEEEGAVFGEAAVSEKRLDELILNYLLREKDKPS